jgi:hypothetical protein
MSSLVNKLAVLSFHKLSQHVQHELIQRTSPALLKQGLQVAATTTVLSKPGNPAKRAEKLIRNVAVDGTNHVTQFFTQTFPDQVRRREPPALLYAGFTVKEAFDNLVHIKPSTLPIAQGLVEHALPQSVLQAVLAVLGKDLQEIITLLGTFVVSKWAYMAYHHRIALALFLNQLLKNPTYRRQFGQNAAEISQMIQDYVRHNNINPVALYADRQNVKALIDALTALKLKAITP